MKVHEKQFQDSKISKGYKQTEVGVIQEDWVVRTLGDVSIPTASGSNKNSSTNGDYPIFGSTGIIGYLNKSKYSGKKILIARVGANARKVYTIDMNRYGISDNTLYILIQYLTSFDLILYSLIYRNLNELVYGSGQPLITGRILKVLPIPLPPTIEEQEKIAEVLSDMDAEIEKGETKIEKYKYIKKGMMQKLLTGQLRLV